jgi:hypothetical protein
VTNLRRMSDSEIERARVAPQFPVAGLLHRKRRKVGIIVVEKLAASVGQLGDADAAGSGAYGKKRGTGRSRCPSAVSFWWLTDEPAGPASGRCRARSSAAGRRHGHGPASRFRSRACRCDRRAGASPAPGPRLHAAYGQTAHRCAWNQVGVYRGVAKKALMSGTDLSLMGFFATVMPRRPLRR